MSSLVLAFGCLSVLGISAATFTGPEVCRQCHPRQYQTQSVSRHARALAPIATSPLAAILTRAPLRIRGGMSYEYTAASPAIGVEARQGAGVARANLEWAFGAGAQGATPVGRTKTGDYFEHRLSWYAAPKRLALTFGHPGEVTSPSGALGVPQDSSTITRCFGCHATGVEPGPILTAMRPGVTCERCHGPGSDHVAAARLPVPKQTLAKSIFNAGHLPAKAVIESCGECHRLPDASSNSPEPELLEPISIRFQPIGLLASRCFREASKSAATRGLSCLSCHDPHADAAPGSATSFSRACLSCHSARAAAPSACPRAKREDCATCHMPRSSPAPYLTFTDHRIRIVR